MSNKKGYILHDLQWDTEFFGVKCLRVYIRSTLSNELFKELKRDLAEYEFITIDNEEVSNQNNQLLSRLKGCFLVDVPLTFRFDCKNYNIGKNSININKNFNVDDHIICLGRDAFKLGRFYKDENITNKKAGELYACWLMNSFNKEDKFFIVDENNMGFLLFSETKDKLGFEIELIAVDRNAQGKGLAKKMITSLKDYSVKSRHEYINVVTQADNITAVNLYCTQKFKLYKCFYTYHYWNNKVVMKC